MYYPSTRLLSILDLLRTHGQMSATALAALLEVDTRTVRRYMVMLADLGMPVETLHGRYGGYRLRPDYKLPPLVFASDEMLGLALGLLFTRQLGLAGVVKGAESAIAKIQAVMPADLRMQSQILAATLVMDLPLGYGVKSETLFTLCRAIYERQQIRLHYQSRNGQSSERLIDPYAVVHKIGMWYLAGYCHLRQDLRVFRLDRIQQLTTGSETFIRPSSFDAQSFVESAIARTPGTWLAEVRLETTLAEAKRLIPPATAILIPTPQGVTMYWYTADLAQLAHFLLGLPCPLVVSAPQQLREELRQLAQRAITLATQDGPAN